MASRSTSFLALISGRRKGLPYDLIRAGLASLSLIYRFTIALRNAYYDIFRSKQRNVGCPVISIGNITVGGTGKTPLAVRIAGDLIERGRKVAILTRGYKGGQNRDGRGHESDEALVLQQRCPKASVVIDPDRIAGGRRARAQGADVLLLDDGFQHRRLARDLDIVLIDATAPFGYGWMLPRGLLREPLKSLRRADVIVLTRSDLVDASSRRLMLAQVNRTSGGKPVVHAVHRIVGFMDIAGEAIPVEGAGAMRAVVFAGIANFDSFRRSVEETGVEIVAAYEYPDHHDYTSEEITALGDVAVTLEANVILTTEKDAVKLTGRWKEEGCRLLVLRLEIEFDEAGDKILSDMMDDTLESGGRCTPTSGD
ncbi:MAG: tetraacyldisaccharide 4'-kinase [Phycisphaerales bacterium]|nr:tetraacyldisaccharide 4'-kinase [Phycisphaerales bacterium]